MSGGSYGYVYSRIEQAAADVLRNHPGDIEYAAFSRLLMRIAAAMKAIEWADSGDTSPKLSLEVIRELIQNKDVLDVIIEQAKQAQTMLDRIKTETERPTLSGGSTTRTA